MKKVTSTCVASIAASLLCYTSWANSAVVQDNTIIGTITNDFESLAGSAGAGTNYDDLITLSGATYGERFDGQTLGSDGDFDTLSGSASGPLTILPGSTSQNLSVSTFSTKNLVGLGNAGHPNLNAFGEGAVSIIFEQDTLVFGLDVIRGITQDTGSANFAFFDRSGASIDSLTVDLLSDGFLGFRVTSGSQIAGVSITNDDLNGVLYDNVTFSPVPIPPAVWLFGSGLLGLVGIARLKKA